MVERKAVSRIRRMAALIVLGALVFGVVPWILWEKHSVRRSVEEFLGVRLDRHHHFYDYARVLPVVDGFGNTIKAFEEDLAGMYEDTGIDLRIALVKSTGGKSIEELAVDMVEDFGIGGKDEEERGVLFLYDLESKRLRIEVGYGLEGYFPDAFVGYLVHDHAPVVFSAGELGGGLRTLMRMLSWRILEAMLGEDFDSTVVNSMRSRGHLSGGAGASVAIPSSRQGDIFRMATKEERAYYSAQPTPGEAYQKYLEWLMAGLGGQFFPAVDILTQQSQGWLATLPMSKAYFHYLLMKLWGKPYKIYGRNNVALLYFTNTPLLEPFYLVRGEKGWQLDLYTPIISGMGPPCDGDFVWYLNGVNSVYTRTFTDKFVTVRGCLRLAEGDNREIRHRGSSSR